MSAMFYSSESSDSDNIHDDRCLDFSYLQLDSQALSQHLKDTILKQFEKRVKYSNRKKVREDSLIIKPILDQEIRGNEENGEDILVQLVPSYVNIDDYYSHHLNAEKLYLHHNMLLAIPLEVSFFSYLKQLDLSNNNLVMINESITSLVNLQNLFLKNNSLVDESFPKDFKLLTKLKELNLSSNQLTKIPDQIYEITSLKYLYIGNNAIAEVLPKIGNLQNLQVLQLGGNQLEKVPDELGCLSNLNFLALCDNRLRKLPRAISQLSRLRSLLLHKNNLCCLPVEIVRLDGLYELSLRDNPLVNKFVNCCAKDMIYTPPSLLELAARVVKLEKVLYQEGDIPATLSKYVNSGQKCVNPKCKGVYFTSCVAHIKFVDFCGKYRVPLMHYLCSSRCSSTTPAVYYKPKSRSDSESDSDGQTDTLRKVLLG